MRAQLAALAICVSVAAVPTVASGQQSGFQSLTRLSAAQEVAEVPVDSDGTALAFVEFDDDFTTFRIAVAFDNLVGSEVTRLHFHCQKPGINGPVAIGLIDRLNPGNDNSDVVSEAGNLIFGELTNADFPGGDDRCISEIGQPVTNVVSLAAAIDAGLIYWNLHTDAFPPGEVRGQVRPTEGQVALRLNDRSVSDDVSSSVDGNDDAVVNIQRNR